MDLLHDLYHVASADPSARRNALLALLRAMDCPFTVMHDRFMKYRPENIIVRFHESMPQRIILGAHYDCVPGSSGANDNGAGVCVLLAWLRNALHHPPPFPLDVVFFDLEERGQIGSRTYLARTPCEDIRVMINLDICGVGDTLVVAPSIDAQNSIVRQAVRRANRSAGWTYRMVDRLPAGDNLPFEEACVPTLSVGMLPAEDIELLTDTTESRWRGDGLVPALSIAETFHNGRRDTIETIEVSAMWTTLRWLERVLMQLSCLKGI